MPRGGGLDAGEAVRHLLALRADDDGHVGDGLAGPGRALLLVLVLQRPRGVRQAGHHEVVHQLRGLLVRHGSRHLGTGGGQRHGSHPDPRPARGTRCRGAPHGKQSEAVGHAGGGADGAKAPGTGREEASCLPVTLRGEGTGKLAPTEGLGPCPHPEHGGIHGTRRWGSRGAVAQPPQAGSWSPRPPLTQGGSCTALRRAAGKGKEAGDEALSRGAVTVGGPRGTGV